MHRSVLLSPRSTSSDESASAARLAALEQEVDALERITTAKTLYALGLRVKDFPGIPEEKLIAEVVSWRIWMARSDARFEARLMAHPPEISSRAICEDEAYAFFCQTNYPSLAAWLARAGYGNSLPLWLINGKPRRPKPQNVRIVKYEPAR